jgi:hypothetical protein
MNLEETMRKHKEMWLKLSEQNIDSFCVLRDLKESCIEEKNILNRCYLCEFTKTSTYIKNCDICPCMNSYINGCLNGLYDDLVDAFDTADKKLFKELAIQIANLPVINPLYK